MATTMETLSEPLEHAPGFGCVGVKAPTMPVIPPKREVVPPASAWTYLCHPRVKEIQDEVHGYFLENWNFPNAKAVRTFLNAKFSESTCLYFPFAPDDRIHFACKLLTVLFLIDDQLEDMSLADGEAYNAKLMPISRGDVLPDRSKPEEFVLYDLWESMRAHDRELADGVLEPTFTLMKAQTDKARLTIKELGQYLDYRAEDVGKAILSALLRFTMGIRLEADELAGMKALEANFSKQISVVNDIYSFEKEEQSARTGHREGAQLCSAVKVLADETNLGITATKRVLWTMVREWENVHDQLVAEKLNAPTGCSQQAKVYMKGLEYQMSGNEQWSKTTLRYK